MQIESTTDQTRSSAHTFQPIKSSVLALVARIGRAGTRRIRMLKDTGSIRRSAPLAQRVCPTTSPTILRATGLPPTHSPGLCGARSGSRSAPRRRAGRVGLAFKGAQNPLLKPHQVLREGCGPDVVPMDNEESALRGVVENARAGSAPPKSKGLGRFRAHAIPPVRGVASAKYALSQPSDNASA